MAAQGDFQDLPQPLPHRVPHCQLLPVQSRDTCENTLRRRQFFQRAQQQHCFGDVVLPWKRVGQPGKAAALTQLGACVIVCKLRVLRRSRINAPRVVEYVPQYDEADR